MKRLFIILIIIAPFMAVAEENKNNIISICGSDV